VTGNGDQLTSTVVVGAVGADVEVELAVEDLAGP
jgi:hypothetical protein